MAWYRAGTIAVTNGSTAVVGTSTQWIANGNKGEGLLAPDGRIYEIADIVSNTSITLATPYLGSTASGQAYAIAPTQSYIRDLAAEVAALVTDYGTLADGAVRFDTAQSLTTEQATQARDNIGFVAAVRASVLTGLTTVSSAAIAATDTVIGAFQKLQAQITANLATLTSHTGASSGAHAASAIANTPAGGISATTVQAALNELDSEKFDKSGGTISGNVGVGATIASWNTGLRSLQVGYSAAIDSPTSSVNTRLMNNAYVDSGGGFKYIRDGVAQVYELDASGNHTWSSGGSGLSGDSISIQLGMKLDSGFNLSTTGGLKTGTTTSAASAEVRHVIASSGDAGAYTQWYNPAQSKGVLFGVNAAGVMQWYSAAGALGSEAYTLQMAMSSGTLLMGTSTDINLWSSTSRGVTVKGTGSQAAKFTASSANANNTTAEVVAGYGDNTVAILAKGDSAYPSIEFYQILGGTDRVPGRFDPNGNWLVGASSGSYHIIRRDVTADVGNYVLEVAGASGATVAAFYGVSSYGASGANAAVKIGRDATTLRSINAGGTINASGADWAEYRKNNGLKIAKGQIVGYKADGTLTLTWSEATMARVKTTNPTMVGGDTWGTEDEIGRMPDEPQFKAPEYTGRARPEDLAPEPQAPAPLEIITVAQQSSSNGRSFSGTINANGSDYAEYMQGPPLTVLWEPVPPEDTTDAVAAAVYALALRDFNAAKAAWEQADAAHAVKHAAWQELAEQHALAVEEWNTDQVEYKTRCDVERHLFDTAIYPEYLRAKAAFEERLEAARQTVDRIAYSGIVPCNVQGATPGHYIVAAEGPGDTIIGLSVRRPTEDQWCWVVGRCLRVLPDGRAEIDVMLS